MKNIKRVNILGCPFDAISFPEAMESIKQCVLDNGRMQVVPGSIDFVMKARRDPIFARELWQADLVVADGVPIIWAASLLGDPINGRVSGTELVSHCAAISAEIGCPVAMIGGKFELTSRAAEKMAKRYPGAQLHALPTPFPLTYEGNRKLVEAITGLNAKIVLVALGAPRQERWVQANLAACRANVGIGIGSAFDIISGEMPRAPQWMQNWGLEWLYRLCLEPKRLWRRYLIEDSPFLWHLSRALIQCKIKSMRVQ
jgi:N-acetylglucosaminyldiphosphoundecaprenol N-acetyl-beta-D-mannosaminyltransferase